MAETKRRTKYSGSGRDRFKRVKRENIYPVRSTIPEAETDSDPITESDTTEHSGREDGVNWPSDDESRLRFSPDKQLKRRDESIKHPAKSNGQLSGGINCERMSSADLIKTKILQYCLPENPTQNRRPLHKNAKQPNQMQTPSRGRKKYGNVSEGNLMCRFKSEKT